MAIIRTDDEWKQKALDAWDNKKDTFTCFATGNTYPVKEDLKSWGFQWCDDGSKCWTLEYCSAWDRFLFERKVMVGKWPGVILEFQPTDPLVSHEMMEQFKKDLEDKING